MTITKKNLKTRALDSAAVTVVGYGASQILRLGANLVMARLLFPEAFGLIALVAVLHQGIHLLSDVGISQSIIQNKRGDDPDFLDTAWTIQAARGTAIWLVMIVVAVPFSSFYGEPILAKMIPVVAFSALIGGFNSVKLVTSNRALTIRRVIAVEFASQATGIAVMVVWGLLSASVWALVVGGVVTSIVKLIAGHLGLKGYNARFSWDRSIAAELYQFGRWIMISSILGLVASMGDRLIFGKLFSIAFLGVYVIAANLSQFLPALISQLSSTVAFPALSHVYREKRSDYASRARATRLALGTIGAVGAGALAASGSEIVNILYDERYRDAGWIFELLSIRMGLGAIGTPASMVLLAGGDSRSQAIIATFRAVSVVAIIAPIAYFFGAKEAILFMILSSAGSVALINFLLWRRNLFAPIIDFSIIFAGITAYFFVDAALSSLGV